MSIYEYENKIQVRRTYNFLERKTWIFGFKFLQILNILNALLFFNNHDKAFKKCSNYNNKIYYYS